MPMITQDMFEIPYPVLKARVVRTLDLAKELSEYWTNTAIGGILDLQIQRVDKAMYDNQTIIAMACLDELMYTIRDAQAQQR